MSFLSVVVATYNRAETLRVTLQRLDDQTLEKGLYEVLVVDDGSPDDTSAVVAARAAVASYPLRYLRHGNSGPGYTQNRGIREAQGPWILLIADDIHPTPGMLEAHYRRHLRDPEPRVAVAGKVLQSPDLPATVFLRHWDPFRYKNFEALDELTYINFRACNVSFKREFMLEYGMFIERFGAAHEDTEVGWRLYRRGGMRLVYCKEALAYHYHVETIDSACRRAFERGRNFDVLAESVDDPGVYIRNHVLTRDLFLYLLRGGGRTHANILAEDANSFVYISRELARRLLFNRLTVPTLFLPLIRAAENHKPIAHLVSQALLRATVSYHFLKGLAELRRGRGVDATRPLSTSSPSRC